MEKTLLTVLIVSFSKTAYLIQRLNNFIIKIMNETISA